VDRRRRVGARARHSEPRGQRVNFCNRHPQFHPLRVISDPARGPTPISARHLFRSMRPTGANTAVSGRRVESSAFCVSLAPPRLARRGNAWRRSAAPSHRGAIADRSCPSGHRRPASPAGPSSHRQHASASCRTSRMMTSYTGPSPSSPRGWTSLIPVGATHESYECRVLRSHGCSLSGRRCSLLVKPGSEETRCRNPLSGMHWPCSSRAV